MKLFSWLHSRKSRPSLAPARPSTTRRARLPLALERLEDRTVPSTVTWVGGNGDWDVASNWSTGTVPGATDNVDLNVPGITITHNAAAAFSVGSLTVEAGSLNMAGALSVTLPFKWTHGTLSGSGSLTALGGMEIDGGSSQLLDGLTLNNGTTAQPGQATFNSGQLPVRDGAVIDNPAGATFTIHIPSSSGFGGLYWDGTGAAPSFRNDGAVVLGTEGGRGQLLLPLVNDGSITAQTGTLELGIIAGSVTGPAVQNSGSIVGTPGTVLNFYNNGLASPAGSTIQADQVYFSSFAQVDGSFSVSGITAINGGASFTGTVTSLGGLQVGGGTADFSAATLQTTTVAGLSVSTSGTLLLGSRSLTVSGLFKWTHGTLSGSGSLTALGGMEIDGGSSQLLDGLTLNNGTTAQPGQATFNSGQLPVRDGAVIDNPAGATFTIHIPSSSGFGGLYWDGTGAAPSFRNDGAVVLGTEGGRGQLLLPLVNDGSVTAQTGTLELGIIAGSVTGPAVQNSGSIVGTPGTMLNFYNNGLASPAGSTIQADQVYFNSFAQVDGSFSVSGITAINGGASFTGTVTSLGDLRVGGGTADFSAATLQTTTVTGLSVSTSGTLLLGSRSLTVSGLFKWTHGTLSGSGSLTALGGMEIDGGSSQLLDGLTLNNGTAAQPGQATFNSGQLPVRDGAVIVNPAGATFTIHIPSSSGFGGLYWDGTGAAPSFRNDGAVVLGTEGGRGQLLLPLVNDGSITAQTGTLSWASSPAA